MDWRIEKSHRSCDRARVIDGALARAALVKQHLSFDPLGRDFFTLFLRMSQRRVRLARLFELMRLLRGCGRRFCCCRCLVVGKVAVVLVVLSVAVDAAGGESVRNMSALRNWRVRCSCGRCACRCRPRGPQGGGCRCWRCSHRYCRCPSRCCN